jgi:hypothetical protein
MFVGHYGPSFAAKALKKSIPLWILFLAAQLVDIFWGIFVILGIEKVHIVPGITATNPLDLYHMPYTHSLLATILWAIAAVACYRLVPRSNGWAAAGAVGVVVFSHWVLDLLVHRPDLPLYSDVFKIGFGLWDYPVVSFVLEVAVLFGGICLYLKATKPKDRVGRYGMVVFGFAMLGVQSIVFFGPPPSSDKAVALTALGSYFVFAGAAYFLERKRA